MSITSCVPDIGLSTLHIFSPQNETESYDHSHLQLRKQKPRDAK